MENNDENIVLDKIKERCKKSKQEFLYFCDEDGNKIQYEGSHKIHLKLLCTKCNTEYITTYTLFVTCKYTCQNCSTNKSKLKNKLPIEKVLLEIDKRCNETNYIFHDFCDKEGNKKEYSNVKDYLILECKKCGYKWTSTTYNRFIHMKTNCPKCVIKEQHEKAKLLENVVLERINQKCKEKNYQFIEIQDNKYTRAIDTRLLIKCNNCGKTWETSYNNFVNGNYGCPNCNKSKLEKEIENLLNERKIEYINQYRTKWLNKQSLDFYLPQYNIGIECQGQQHFKENTYFGELKTVKERDERKRKLCEENGIKLLYYSNLNIEYPYKVFENKEELLKEIK